MAKKIKKEKGKVRKILEGVLLGVFLVLIGASCFAMISSSVNKRKSGNEYAPTAIGDSYMPLVVLTDSMEPDIKTNSAIFIKSVSCDEIIEAFNNHENVDLCFDDTFAYNQNISSLYTSKTASYLDGEYRVNDQVRRKLTRTTESSPSPIRTLTHRLFYVQVNNDVAYGEGKYFFFVEGINTESKNYAASDQYQVFTENQLYGRVTKSSLVIGGIFSFVKSPLGLIILLLIPTLYMVISSVLEIFKAYEPEVSSEGETAELSGLSKKDIKRLKEEMLNQIMNKNEEEDK